MPKLSFFGSGSVDDPMAWRNGEEISRARFAADVMSLANRLPEKAYVVNHCQDRYRFTVGLAAALYKNIVSLFPPSSVGNVISELLEDYPDAFVLSDQRESVEGVDIFQYIDTPAEQGDASAVSELSFDQDQLAAIAFTSGSTGKPRPYRKHWGAFHQEAIVAGRALNLEHERGGYIVATVPAQHMYGFITSVIMPLQNGFILGAEQPFYPEDIRLALEARSRPSILVTTPVHIRACVREQTRLPQLEFILSSTAPLAKSLADEAERIFETRVLEFYGSTETGAIAVRHQQETDVWSTFDGVTVKLGNQGFTVSSAYFYESPIILSDNVEVYNDREFVLFGRNTDLVKVGGKRAMIGDLNHQLLAINGVVDGTFFMPDAGESGREARLTAFVVAPGLSKEAILEALRKHIDPVFLPRPLRLVESLPRNATGKLPRGNLVRLYQEYQHAE